jgi:hypothetical protein
MPILRWRAAHGDAAIIRLACADTVHLSPWDGRVDSNIVHIAGQGVISSFGWGQAVTMRVLFDGGIILKHSAHLQLLGLQDREIAEPAIGIYCSDGNSYWNEINFTETGAREFVRRLDAIDARLDAIVWQLDEHETRITATTARNFTPKTMAIPGDPPKPRK